MVISAATLMVVLDTSIINLALPKAQADLGMSTANRGWVITAYTLTFGGRLLLGGRVADLLGRKRILIGLIGFAAASALGGIAPNAAVLFTGRARHVRPPRSAPAAMNGSLAGSSPGWSSSPCRPTTRSWDWIYRR